MNNPLMCINGKWFHDKVVLSKKACTKIQETQFTESVCFDPMIGYWKNNRKKVTNENSNLHSKTNTRK